MLVGGGQITNHEGGVEPVDLIASAARRAADEAGSARLLERVDTVKIVGLLSWRYRDPGRLVAERIGARPHRSGYSGSGGSTPQQYVNRAAEDIRAGRADVVLIGGAEAWRTRMKLRAAGERPDWTRQDDDVPAATQLVGDVPMAAPSERRIGLDRPSYVYPLFEHAIRAAAGRSITEHARVIGELWAGFSTVAAANPFAWTRREYSASELVTPSPDNRMVSSPYTKLLNSNNMVDQGAALVMCSAGTAESLGVPRSAWVFPQSGTEAHDTEAIAARSALHRSPAINAAGAEALRLAGIGIDEVEHLDVYSCFPSAVQVAAAELGLPVNDPGRPLTVTGGLTFSGGPWNNYSTHAIATVATRLRESPGSYGMVTANSGYLTKHAIGVYRTEPPEHGFHRVDVQERVDAAGSTPVAQEYEGSATVESWTVLYDREGAPEKAFVAALTPDGERTLAVAVDDGDLETWAGTDVLGASVDIAPDGVARLR